MSVEEAVKRRHQFEDQIKNFCSLTFPLTNRELELGLARIMDAYSNADNDLLMLQGKFKTYLVTILLQLRPSDYRPISRGRFKFFSGLENRLQELVYFSFSFPDEFIEASFTDYNDNALTKIIRT